MDDKFQLEENGQQLQQQDVNFLGEQAAMAGDRLLAEILRLSPYSGSVGKAVVPYRHQSTAQTGTVVAHGGADGKVCINPFRAVVGSRVASSSDATANWRDIRTGIFVGDDTTVNPARKLQSLSANSSGNPRWDLVYAIVALDATAESDTRKVKDPTTKLVAEQTVVLKKKNAVTIAVVTGTPAATPAFPVLPSDSGSNYYIPLAYVRVPNGWNATSTATAKNIVEIAPVVCQSSALGAQNMQPANAHYKPGGDMLQQSGFTFTGTNNQRPDTFIPPSMVGAETLIIALKLPSGAGKSLDDGDIIDDRDWRGRICSYVMAAKLSGASAEFPWVSGALANNMCPDYSNVAAITGNWAGVGFGQTFVNDASGGTASICADINGDDYAPIADSTRAQILCDSTTGKLKLKLTGEPNCNIFLMLTFTAPFVNA